MKERQGKERQEETTQLIIFKLGEEEFGVDILQVREIEKLDQGITRVPKAPPFVEGVINLRGEIIPIVDLRVRFGLTLPELGLDSRVIIVEVGEALVGMLVDAVVEVLRIPVSAIEPPPPITKGVDSYYLAGVAKLEDRLIVLLNLERTLSPEEEKQLSEAELELE
ncbi:MAG TPA: chemotaxis protein CheW [Firmicutes bacterium]|uniref:Chemotaxis protein CheW n=1 Tax=Capillibacterium thermochitinicola TaxID=2699427 RepID=A0A8J6I3Z3_9FIRM|nr:chemotaxis protein CheW [Capillibacterium thermochitinicola]MBA2134039.1 chemotaxis protein CheW [Capillibacterium thermochitinicola]HHW12416.1 chemotaxis protein CheW [Bacillota bacterium]